MLRQAADSIGMRGTVALIGGAPAGASFSLAHMSTLWGKRVIGTPGDVVKPVLLIPQCAATPDSLPTPCDVSALL